VILQFAGLRSIDGRVVHGAVARPEERAAPFYISRSFNPARLGAGPLCGLHGGRPRTSGMDLEWPHDPVTARSEDRWQPACGAPLLRPLCGKRAFCGVQATHRNPPPRSNRSLRALQRPRPALRVPAPFQTAGRQEV
jgi:hypothetical protein